MSEPKIALEATEDRITAVLSDGSVYDATYLHDENTWIVSRRGDEIQRTDSISEFITGLFEAEFAARGETEAGRDRNGCDEWSTEE